MHCRGHRFWSVVFRAGWKRANVPTIYPQVTNHPGFSGTVPIWSGLFWCPGGSIWDTEMSWFSANGPGWVWATEMSSHCADINSIWHVCDELHHDRTYLYVICLCITLAYWRNNLRTACNGRFAKEVRKGMTVQFQHELKTVILFQNVQFSELISTFNYVKLIKYSSREFRALMLGIWTLVISWCKG